MTGVPCGLLDHVRRGRSQRDRRGTPGMAMVATVDRSGQAARSRRCGPAPAGRRRRPSRWWRWGHGHGQVDVVVLAGEDPLEPVLLGPGQVPDEAEQDGERRVTVALEYHSHAGRVAGAARIGHIDAQSSKDGKFGRGAWMAAAGSAAGTGSTLTPGSSPQRRCGAGQAEATAAGRRPGCSLGR